jgi:tetrahedral aminopeptidase
VLLKELSEARGLSGNEEAVRSIILSAVQEHVDECHVDALGNLICFKKARRVAADAPWPRRVMVAAHMDEVGLLVTGFNGDGSLRFDRVGGIDGRVLLSKQVLVGKDAVPGVIGYRPIHLISREERERVADVDRIAIDIGATDKGSAQKMVKLGDYVSFRTSFEILDDEGFRTVKGKAFDDRAGCAVLAELVKEEFSYDLYAVFTTEEEVGLRGAKVASYAVAPDVAFTLEGTICDDMPKKKDLSPVTELGKGPVITFMDRSFIADQRLVKLLVGTAQRLGIPYQFKRAVAGGTDSGVIHMSGEGVPTVTVAIPARYIHSPVSIMSLADFDFTVQLMRDALHTLEGGL